MQLVPPALTVDQVLAVIEHNGGFAGALSHSSNGGFAGALSHSSNTDRAAFHER